MAPIRPTARQLEFQSWELGLFLHFGIRTFHEGHVDWDGRPMDAAAFAPSALDCGQWARTAARAGFRYAVMTAKHHDGFALWPSVSSEFSVAQSPWRDGRGDVVREFVDACRVHDVRPGLYYSPAEMGSAAFRDDPAAYDEHFLAQITELMSDYGQIDLLWFDGCGSADHEYDWPRITAEIRRLQPEILIFNMGDPDYRWVGNEEGIAPVPCWNVAEFAGQARWLPAECDARMRAKNWFYSDADEHTVKSARQLMGMYDYSVGHGCNLILNIGPDRRGLLPDADAARLVEFGDAIRQRFAAPAATLADAEQVGEGVWHCGWDAPRIIDHAVAAEDLTEGERIRRFRVTLSVGGGDRITVHEGHNVGHKMIAQFPPIEAHDVRLEVIESDAPARLAALDFHSVGS